MWNIFANFVDSLNAPWWIDTILWFLAGIVGLAAIAICIAIPLSAALWITVWLYKGTIFCIEKIFELPAMVIRAIRKRMGLPVPDATPTKYPTKTAQYRSIGEKFLNVPPETERRRAFLIAEAHRDGTGLLAAFPDWALCGSAESGLVALSDRTAETLKAQFRKERALLLAANRTEEMVQDEELDFYRWKVILLTKLVEKGIHEAIESKDPRILPSRLEDIRR